LIVLAEPCLIANTMPPTPRERMMTTFSSAPTLLTHLPISRRMTPTATTSHTSTSAMITWGHLPAGHCAQWCPNSWKKTPAKSRNTDGIHSATFTQYQ
jgi:hypothetical protein